MGQIVQYVGVVLILAAFLMTQSGRTTTMSVRYLVLNLIGGLLLGISALDNSQWGFVVLETVWSLVAAWGLVRRARGGGLGTSAA